MTSAAQTGFIGNFRPRLRFFINPGEIISDHRQSGEFSFDRSPDPRRKMALGAMNIIVSRFFPRRKIRPHIVTGYAKAGLRRCLDDHYQGHPDEDDEKGTHQDQVLDRNVAQPPENEPHRPERERKHRPKTM